MTGGINTIRQPLGGWDAWINRMEAVKSFIMYW